MATTWVLVAHEAGARLFEQRGLGKGLLLVEELHHPAGRERDQDFDADRPGRSFRRNAGDARRAAVSRSEGSGERAVANFARKVAAKLQHARTQALYERLVLVAPPAFLGMIRASLDAPTARLVVGSLAKDLATSDANELLQRVGDVMAV